MTHAPDASGGLRAATGSPDRGSVRGPGVALGALALLIGAWALPLGVPAVFADDLAPTEGSTPDLSVEPTSPTSEPPTETSEPSPTTPPTSEPPPPTTPPTSEPPPATDPTTTLPEHGGPIQVHFAVHWEQLDGSPVGDLDATLPPGWRDAFVLSGAGATGGGEPTSATCVYPATGDLTCTYVNPGHEGTGLVIPSRETATYQVSVGGAPDGWSADGSTVGTFLGMETCPPDGGLEVCTHVVRMIPVTTPTTTTTVPPDHGGGGGGQGNPTRILFEVRWQPLAGPAVTNPDALLPAGWRDAFELSGASETGHGRPTSAACVYPASGGDLGCTYVNPGHEDLTGLVVPARASATYQVAIEGVPDGWSVDESTVGTFLGRGTCPRGSGGSGGSGGSDGGSGSHSDGDHSDGDHSDGDHSVGDHTEVVHSDDDHSEGCGGSGGSGGGSDGHTGGGGSDGHTGGCSGGGGSDSGTFVCTHVVEVIQFAAPTTTLSPTTTVADTSTTTTTTTLVASSPGTTSPAPTSTSTPVSTTAVLGSGSSLPSTGSGSGWLAMLALALVSAGVALTRVARPDS